MTDEVPWQRLDDAVFLRVRLTPKASKDAVEGIEETAEGPALKVKVRALPSEGAANAALTRLVSKWLDVPKTGVSIFKGHKSRIKRLRISHSPDTVIAQLERLRQDG